MVRVLHLLPSLFGGGMERLVVRLMRGPSELSGTVDGTGRIEHGLCVLRDADHALLDECRSRATTWVLGQGRGEGGTRDCRSWLRLRRIVRQFRPDVVHALSTGVWLDAAGATWGFGHVRLVLAFHGRTDLTPVGWLRRRISGWAGRQADVVLTVSREAAASLHRESSIPLQKLRTIPNGVDTGLYCPATTGDERRRTRAALGLPETSNVVICVANMVPIKGLHVLLNAWRHVQMTGRSAHLLIVGDGPLRRPLEALARQLRCDASVRFLGERGDVPALLRAADLFVLPGRYEACSLAVLEAMASGLAVLTTAVGGLPELITTNQTGWLVPPDDADRLFQAIHGALLDRAARERIGHAARAEVLRRFSLDLCVHRYTSLFHELVRTECGQPAPEEEGVACAG